MASTTKWSCTFIAKLIIVSYKCLVWSRIISVSVTAYSTNVLMWPLGNVYVLLLDRLKELLINLEKTIHGVFLKVWGTNIPKYEHLNRKLTDKYDNDNNKHDPHPTPPSSPAVLLKSLRLQAQLGEVLLCQVRWFVNSLHNRKLRVTLHLIEYC